MNNNKLYNIIFPIWILRFIPPVIFLSVFGNYILDSLVLIGCFYVFKPSLNLKSFYKNKILKVWLFGFIADFIGSLFLFAIVYLDNMTFFDLSIDIPYKITHALTFNPFDNFYSFILVCVSMLISFIFIYLLNHKFTFKDIDDALLRFKLSFTLAIITIPWTFLLPTNLFYYN